MFGGKYRSKVVRIDGGVIASPLFRVDIPSSSQRVWLGTETSGMEVDDEVELGQVLRPPYLASSEQFCCGKIFQVFVVGNDVDWVRRSF